MVNHGNLTRNYSIPIIIIILIIIIIVIKKVMQLRNSPCFSCAACSLSDTWPFASNCLCYRTTNNGTCLAIGAIKLLTKKNQNNQMATPPRGGRSFPLASFRKEVSIKLHLPSSVWCPDSVQAPASEKWRGRLGVVAMAWDMTWILYRWIFHETKHPATGVHPLMETLIWLGLMWVKQWNHTSSILRAHWPSHGRSIYIAAVLVLSGTCER